ncbi:unnamed protein product [Prunus armeniaca]|uniref:Uncharacterized protein n=1 Tax=Prunus armeniaca TaxID=36596 RepID=A0A6J5U310_PRUAR|nr:unnamed protein product [Prunus armeniaca]
MRRCVHYRLKQMQANMGPVEFEVLVVIIPEVDEVIQTRKTHHTTNSRIIMKEKEKEKLCIIPKRKMMMLATETSGNIDPTINEGNANDDDKIPKVVGSDYKALHLKDSSGRDEVIQRWPWGHVEVRCVRCSGPRGRAVEPRS